MSVDALDAKQRTRLNKLQKKLRREVGRAIADFNMIGEGDKVMVCLSGGKDSYTMLEILRNLQHSAPVNFELVAVNLDQKQPSFPEHVLPEYLEKEGVAYHIRKKTPIPSSRRRSPRAKPPVVCVPACAGAACTGLPRKSAPTRSPWAITVTTSLKPCS